MASKKDDHTSFSTDHWIEIVGGQGRWTWRRISPLGNSVVRFSDGTFSTKAKAISDAKKYNSGVEINEDEVET